MGNYDTRPIRFLQSPADFPLTVSLGDKAPAWGLSRWNGGGLRFVPPDNEGFALRGDKRRLVYKGRRRSHRFTILGNNAFEYDVILNREPDSNVVSLFMEGAEQFDFFRQPDFLTDPLLAGSYAVYKKETLLGEGTGKLCHIHKPEIIDAKGRRCWGDLSIAGNRLCITIPETFLSEAVYPVVVDPTIGTTTVGSQTKIGNSGYDYEDYPWLEGQIGLNKFTVSQGGAGVCTAYVYAYYNTSTQQEQVSHFWPGIFSDNNNKPYQHKSRNENEIDVFVGYKNYSTGRVNYSAGWKSGTFALQSPLQAGTPVWFGGRSDFFTTRFDYGGSCYRIWPDIDAYPEAEDDFPPYVEISQWDTLDNYKFSWYFTYEAITAQNYIRTLTQGVTLDDNRKLAANFNRAMAQTVKGSTAIEKLIAYSRAMPETVRAADTNKQCGTYNRAVPDTAKIIDTAKQWRAYFRGIVTEAAITAETSYSGVYFRNMTETVQAASTVFRGLLLFVKILTISLVRDFILRRFLKSNEDLVLKSCVCREITLDSTIH